MSESGLKKPEFYTSYSENTQDNTLNLKEDDGKYVLDDPNGRWEVIEHGLKIRIRYVIKNPTLFFGENGIADNCATLGIATRLKSPDSNRSETHKTKSEYFFNSDSTEIEFETIIKLDHGTYRGTLGIESLLYLVNPGKNPGGFADMPGFILGIFDYSEFELEGEGTLFPIDTKKIENGDLWELRCEWDDPKEDLFINSVVLILNENHKYYKELELNKESEINLSMLEIMCQATMLLIEEIVKDVPDFENISKNKSFEHGSVCEAVSYMVNVFAQSYFNPVELSNQIHSHILGKSE